VENRDLLMQDVKERWFPGVHSDVGGGYPESESGLWREPFRWMVDEARLSGLLLNESRFASVMSRSTESAAWKDPQHESLTGAWWIAECFPKLRWDPSTRKHRPALGLGRCRRIPEGAPIHRWTLQRLQDVQTYRPRNLSAHFVSTVLALTDLPESLPYVSK
jgi:hypothetical protein